MEDNIHTIINEIYDNNEPTIDNIDPEVNPDKDLDTSWINENERLYKINENVIREPMDTIPLKFVYINRNMYIDKVIQKKQPLVKGEYGTILSKETLLQLIQTNKIKTPFSKYKLDEVLLYLVNLDPDNIQSFSKNENIDDNSKSFLNVISILNDVKVDDSIFIFHNINSIYFIFQEIESINHRHTLKSILKTAVSTDNKDGVLTKSKKVRMNLPTKDLRQIYRSRNTRKVSQR